MPLAPESQSQSQQQAYSDAHVAATLSLMPFSDFCKLRDDWATKPLIRGRYNGLCGGDAAQRERREEFENITLPAPNNNSSSGSRNNSGNEKKHTIVLCGQVEAYSRSAAGKTIDNHTQRTPLALEKAMHFLVEHYLRSPHTPLVFTDPFRIWNYLWDRFRGVRTTWGPQLPPSNVSVTGYVDSETQMPLPVAELQRESYRRVRWLEFTAAALAVGGAYLCLTPRGCERFMQDKKQFLESMSQCFTDLTVFYRAEQRLRNAEFFSVLLLLYGLNQELKVEDRATFCRYTSIMVNGEQQLCPERTSDSVNLAQVIRELEKQPYMLTAQPVRVARELIHCWTSRNWFYFFFLCKTAKLTLLQRAVVFQSFTYCRYRAVLDLVLPNLYVYPKLRVRSDVAVAELAELLMMDHDHCLLFLRRMGLAAHLEEKPCEQSPTSGTSGLFPEYRTSHATAPAPTAPQTAWFLTPHVPGTGVPVTAEQLEERCPNKSALFFPTYPEFFGFRVWRDAYARFPDAKGLARPGEGGGSGGGGGGSTHESRSAAGSPAGRDAARTFSAFSSSSLKPPVAAAAAPVTNRRGNNANRGRHDRHRRHDDDYGEDGGSGGSAYGDEDAYYRDEYGDGLDEEYDDDANSYHGGSEGEGEDGSHGQRGEDSGNDDRHEEEGDGDDGDHDHYESSLAENGDGQIPRDASGDTAPLPLRSSCQGTTDSALMRQYGCPVNLMEVLEAYCPPYNSDVAALRLHDAEETLFAALREHRVDMLRRCRQTQRRARHWQQQQSAWRDQHDSDPAHADDEETEAWIDAMEQESVSTSSSILYSDDDDDEMSSNDGDEEQRNSAEQTQGVTGEGRPAGESGEAAAAVPPAVAQARALLSALSANALYAAARKDQEDAKHEKKRQEEEEEEERAKQRQADAEKQQQKKNQQQQQPSSSPHEPVLALPEVGSCTVVPLPDNYGGAGNKAPHRHAEGHGRSGEDDGGDDESAESCCNAQTAKVTVESPATVLSSRTPTFSLVSPSDLMAGRRESSAETVVPLSVTQSSGDGGGGGALRFTFPSRPTGATTDTPSAVAGAGLFSFPSSADAATAVASSSSSASPSVPSSRPSIPPLRFNTAMPDTTGTTSASSSSPSWQAPAFGTLNAAAAAAASPDKRSQEERGGERRSTTTLATTPSAAQQRAVRDGSADSNDDNSNGGSSSSSAPLEGYSHLKQQRADESPSRDDYDGEDDNYEEEDEEGGSDGSDDVDTDEGSRVSGEAGDASDSASDELSRSGAAQGSAKVSGRQGGRGAQSEEEEKAKKKDGDSLSLMPQPFSSSSSSAPAASVTAAADTPTAGGFGQSRGEEHASVTSPAWSAIGVATGEVRGGFFATPDSGWHGKRTRSEGADARAERIDQDDGSDNSYDGGNHSGNETKRVKLDESDDFSSTLPIRPSDANVFLRCCVPAIVNYLELWTQLTYGDEAALTAAARCAYEAKTDAEGRRSRRAHERASSSSALPLSRISGYAVKSQTAVMTRRMARRARDIFTSAVLRASASEYSQQMLDTAAIHAAAPSHRANEHSRVVPEGAAGHEATPSLATGRSVAASLDALRISGLSRGCSAALVADDEVCAMLAVEAGDVQALNTHTTATASQQQLQQMQGGSPYGHADVFSHLCPGSIEQLQASLTKALDTVGSAHSGLVLGHGDGVRRSGDARGGVRGVDGQRLTVPALVSAAVTDGLTRAAEVARERAAVTAGTPSALTSVCHAPSPSSLFLRNRDSNVSVVFDPSIQSYVVWRALPPSAAASPTTSIASATRSEKPVLQLTSVYVLVSSASATVGSAAHTRHEATYGRAGSQHASSNSLSVSAAALLQTLYRREKERWVAQLLLPAADATTTNTHHYRYGGAASGPRTDYRNDRAVWLSAPHHHHHSNNSSSNSSSDQHSEDDEGTPAIARLFQKDSVSDVPICTHHTNAATTALVPLASRVALYGCSSDALPSMRVRRDGGVRLQSRHPHTIPNSCATTPAMAHQHYTALVVIDTADSKAMPRALETLQAVVDSHEPHTRIDEDGVVRSQNWVAGVLLCFVESQDTATVAQAEGASRQEYMDALSASVKRGFWLRWDEKHAEAEAEESSLHDSARTMRWGGESATVAEKRKRKELGSLLQPAVVSVFLPYGDAKAAAAELQLGMRTILATYAQQAAAVLSSTV